MRQSILALLALILLEECVAKVTMEWSHVSASIKTKKGTKQLLTQACGKATPGRLLAIMGPSGSGKTTLLNSISGNLVQAKGLCLEGCLLVNGELSKNGVSAVNHAYVKQDDIFYTQMTVKETLDFHAKLRLPRTMPATEKDAMVESIMGKLALTKASNTIVGGGKVRGISGGERKRLSIACELLAEPDLLFLDEPTSGLDSFQAERVVQSLRVLAKEGKTVVCVIHQPSGSVYNMFDDLLLLSEGRMQYFGPSNEVVSYFGRLGVKCPSNINAGEFCLNTVSVDHESKDTDEASHKRIHDISNHFQATIAPKFHKHHHAHQAKPQPEGAPLARRRPHTGFLTQAKMLFGRALREITGNKVANVIKLVQQVSTALIYGGIYTLSDSQSSIQDRLGLISLMAIGNTNLAVASTIRAFPKEKEIVMSDRSKNIYGAVPYFLSKVLAEAPVGAALSLIFGGLLYPLVGLQKSWPKFLKFLGITTLHSIVSSSLGLFLGAVAPSSDAALALLPPVIVLMIIFNGFNITEENTPKLLWWMPKLSVIRWGFEALCLNEFQGLRFKCDRPHKAMCANTGMDALERVNVGLGKSSVQKAVTAEFAILGACYLQTLRVLCGSGPRYAKMEMPEFVFTEDDKDKAASYVHNH